MRLCFVSHVAIVGAARGRQGGPYPLSQTSRRH
jgi:hypothetical protein